MHFRRFITLVILFLAVFQLNAQSKWLLTAGGALGFNNSTNTLWQYEVENFTSSGVFFHIAYSYHFYDKFSLTLEPGILQYYDKVKVNNVEVDVYGYSLELPFSLGYSFHKKWTGFIGYSFQNYREIDEMALLKSYNLRNNIFIGSRYYWRPHWAVYFRYSRMVSKQVEYLTARQFENQFFLGITFCFGKKVREGSGK